MTPHTRRTNKHMHRPSEITIIGTISRPAAGMCFDAGQPWVSSLLA